MNKDEFLSACEKYTDGAPYISDENFALVDYVYNWHPSISVLRGTDQMAMLYCTFGMNVINDMYPHAEEMQFLDCDLQEAKAKVEEAKAKVEEIENKIKDEINT